MEKESVEPYGYYTSYHGYWPTSLTETNEQFGSMEDLRALIRTAHQHGIAVLIDCVANHVHEDHPLFRQHPEWAAPLVLPDGRRNIRLFDEHPFTTWFDTFLPTLDYENHPEIIDAMAENGVWWLRETGADGYRHDAVKHIPEEFWRTLTARLRAEIEQAPDRRRVYQVGETISGYDTVARFVGPDLLDGQFDFPGYFVVRDVLGYESAPMADLARAMRGAQAFYPTFAIMSPLIGNHDFGRFMAFADGDLPQGRDEKEVARTAPPRVDRPDSYDKIELAYAWLLTQPGAPMIYYGDEIGMTGAGDPDNRRMMKWEGVGEREQAVRDVVGLLGQVRRQSIALRRGIPQVIHEDPEWVVFARVANEETVIVALARNPGAEQKELMAQWPDSWGAPKAIEPIALHRMNGQSEGVGIRLECQSSHGFGIWRLHW